MGESESGESTISQQMLSALQLVNLRNPGQLPGVQCVGQKDYSAKGQEEEIRNLLDKQRDLLSVNRATRACDMMKAEWDAELKKAVAHSIKGKYTQHMGRTFERKHLLSPEETIFLLENGILDLMCVGKPLSTEEAYFSVLDSPIAIERYKVYAHLSRQGYLVVMHQGRIDMDRYEKFVQSKSVKKEKRRMQYQGNVVKGKRKRRSNTNNNTENVDTSNDMAMSSKPLSKDGSSSVSADKAEDESVVSDDAPTDVQKKKNTKESERAASPVLSLDDLKDQAVGREKELNENDATQCGQAMVESRLIEAVINSSFDDTTVLCEDMDLTTEIQSSSTIGDLGTHVDMEGKCTVGKEKGNVGLDSSVLYSLGADNAIDDILANNLSSEDLVNLEAGDSDNSFLVSDIDSLTCANELPKDNDDVVFVEVAKKDRVLAVIDLLSDDDDDDEEEEDDMELDIQFIEEKKDTEKSSDKREDGASAQDTEDDDIQIIEELSAPSANVNKKKRVRSFKFQPQTNREFSSSALADGNRKLNSISKWPFPNLLLKTVVCLSRPPPHLLPMNVHLNKESYTIALKMITGGNTSVPRVWNSYRDIQDRRRRNHFRDSHNSGSPALTSDLTDSMFQLDRLPTFPTLSGVRNETQTNSSDRNVPPASDHHYYEYLKQVQRTALCVAHTFLNEVTMNMQFPPNFHRRIPPIMNDSSLPTFNKNSQMWNNPNNRYFPRGVDSPNDRLSNPGPFPTSTNTWGRGQNSSPFKTNQNGVPRSNQANQSGGARWEMYPSGIPKIQAMVTSWGEYKSVMDGSPTSRKAKQDIRRNPQELAEVLWSSTLKPLVDRGTHTMQDVMKVLKVTRRANILKDCFLDRHLSDTHNVEVAFDVYLPGTFYKKTCPCPPHHRVIVMRANDPLPDVSEVISVQRRFNDNASLQFAIVDGSDVAFYSFNNVDIPTLVSL